jgi:hypothetical protein
MGIWMGRTIHCRNLEAYHLMKISELLLEYNEQRLIQDFGKKIEKKSSTDTTCPKNLSSQELIEKISSLDPTRNKELTFWIVLNYANGRIARYEDIASRAIPSLLKFKALLRKPNLTPPLEIRDVNSIKGLSALEDILDKYEEKDVVSNKEAQSSEEQNFYASGQAELIYNDSQVKVVSPKTKEASCFFGINTRWCTAGKSSNNRFSYYDKQGPLYIVLIKKENARYQFHFQTGQFMDEKDDAIEPTDLANGYPILWKIFTPLAEKNESVILNSDPSESVQLFSVQQDGKAIRYIENPSKKIQLAAVQENGYAIRYIENPSEDVKLVAVRENGAVIKYIKHPSKKIQIAAVQSNGYAMQWIDEPCDILRNAPIKPDGYVIFPY